MMIITIYYLHSFVVPVGASDFNFITYT